MFSPIYVPNLYWNPSKEQADNGTKAGTVLCIVIATGRHVLNPEQAMPVFLALVLSHLDGQLTLVQGGSFTLDA